MNSNTPLISIIVPCYNQAQYLDECLQSVQDQTFENWECIIVDDGSIDDTENIVKNWIAKDTRFRNFKQTNKGVASARNFGIQRAKGKWILPLDGDDKIGIDYLTLASKEFDNDYDLIYCNAEFFGSTKGDFSPGPYSYSQLLLDNCFFVSSFFKKEKWASAGGFDSQLIDGFEDWEFFINILNPNSKVLKLDNLGFYYRRKEISRDKLIQKDKEKFNASYNYIYKKHLQKYIFPQENGIYYYRKNLFINKEYEQLKEKVYKSWFSRLLFKLFN